MREIYRYLIIPDQPLPTADLHPARHAAELGLKAAVQAMGVWHTRISELERGMNRHAELEDQVPMRRKLGDHLGRCSEKWPTASSSEGRGRAYGHRSRA